MAELCPVCRRPFAVELIRNVSATDGCYTRLPGRFFRDERRIACLQIGLRLRDQQLAAAVAVVEAARVAKFSIKDDDAIAKTAAVMATLAEFDELRERQAVGCA